MATILDLYEKSKPVTSKVNLVGGDKTPIEADGGLNLSKDETKLKQARGGILNTKTYTEKATNL
jgi:pyridoxine 5'-phosphate synthase PdxJ